MKRWAVAALLVAAFLGSLGAAAARAADGRALAPSTRFFVPPPDQGAVVQGLSLLAHHDARDALLIAAEEAVPRAVWLTSGTPADAARQVHTTLFEAAFERAVPVFVVYDVPGRDCGGYSQGGANTPADYAAYVDAVAAALGAAHAVVILEPDGLANVDCLDAAQQTERYAEITAAVARLEQQPNVAVYLDAGHSAWQSVGTIAQRLVQAGVQDAQGFFLNVSNYQYTQNEIVYGTWVSDCIAYATIVIPGDYGDCGNQYWNGGPASGWTGVAMSPYGVWSATASDPALNTAGVDSRYAQELGSTVPTTHFVVDTSRNGTGPNDMSTYAAAPYDEPTAVIATLRAGNWCNPPAAGLGARPTAGAGNSLVDALLWIKTPGESDGQCDSAGGVRAWDYGAYDPWGLTDPAQQALFDPLWGQVDPSAGAWFPQQALQLAQEASPALLP
jgi:endoglucanase